MMNILEIAKANVYNSIEGRYVTNSHIIPFLESLPKFFNLQVEGKSVLGKDIFSVTVGTGSIKIYIWSQMHGNESTTTKAVIDLLSFLNSENEQAQSFLKTFTFKIIPILNPDGAEAYTRVNAVGVDLNRDSVDISQPESFILRKCLNEFKPDFAFNMHDQRTLFAAGLEAFPATISFLAPSFNVETDVNEVRTTAMQIICEMHDEVSKYIPKQIGRFDDAFNINCIGDYITHLGIPTILFEAGHYQNDYQREFSRNIVFVALYKALISIENSDYLCRNVSDYFIIPENRKLINDILLKNIRIVESGNVVVKNLGIQYKEELNVNEILFIPILDNELILNHQFGYLEVDASDFEITTKFELCDLLNEMKLFRNENGVYDVNYLLKN